MCKVNVGPLSQACCSVSVVANLKARGFVMLRCRWLKNQAIGGCKYDQLPDYTHDPRVVGSAIRELTGLTWTFDQLLRYLLHLWIKTIARRAVSCQCSSAVVLLPHIVSLSISGSLCQLRNRGESELDLNYFILGSQGWSNHLLTK